MAETPTQICQFSASLVKHRLEIIAFKERRSPKSLYQAYWQYRTILFSSDKLRFKATQFFFMICPKSCSFCTIYSILPGSINVLPFIICLTKLKFKATQKFIFCPISWIICPIYPMSWPYCLWCQVQ